MKLPRGELLRKRVVTDLGTPLSTALDDRVTGYLRLESQESLLLDADGAGVITFEDGVPVVAYHTGTDTGGAEALPDIAVAGPSRIELYRLEASVLDPAHDVEDLRVAPAAPAERLAGNSELASRTRAAAPETRVEVEQDTTSPVESFLEDEDTIETIRERAREEAQTRADEWGFETVD